MSEEKKIELSDDDKAIKKYRIILGILALISGLLIVGIIEKSLRFNKGYIYVICILPIVIYICIYVYRLFLSQKKLLKIVSYTLFAISLTHLTLLIISIFHCLYYGYNKDMCSIRDNCDKLEQKIICEFFHNNQLIFGSMLNTYTFLSIFFISILTIAMNTKKRHILNENNIVFLKTISFILSLVIILFFPTIYTIIIKKTLFNM